MDEIRADLRANSFPELADSVVGCVLGTMLGDSLGSGCEFWPCDDLNARLLQIERGNRDQEFASFARIVGPIAGFFAPNSTRYTDDTEMTFGVIESISSVGTVDSADLAARFANNFDPVRGYGPAAYGVLSALKRGAPWDEPARAVFGGAGSFGNGAAMRAAPIGLWFHDASPEALRDAAAKSARPTHTHRLGIEGAIWQAAATAAALRARARGRFDADEFLSELVTCLREPEFLAAHAKLARHANQPLLPHCDAADLFGAEITAVESVPVATYAFLKHPDSFVDAVTYAIRCGGDTDTIGAMCGAISGALVGGENLPSHWLETLENGPRGRDFARRLSHEFTRRIVDAKKSSESR